MATIAHLSPMCQGQGLDELCAATSIGIEKKKKKKKRSFDHPQAELDILSSKKKQKTNI